VDGESSSENWGYAFFRAIRPEEEPKPTKSNILKYPCWRISKRLLKKKTQNASTMNGVAPTKKVHWGDHMRIRDQRPTVVDQRSIATSDATTTPSSNEKRPNNAPHPGAPLTNQVSTKSEMTAPAMRALLFRSDASVSNPKCITMGHIFKVIPDKLL
jgi:hypothetical protein